MAIYQFAGAHCIREVGTNQHTPASAMTSYGSSPTSGARPQIIGALGVGCWTTFGLRIGWDHVETGRIAVTSTATVGATSIACAGNNHPALSAGTVLSFDFGTGMSGPVNVTVGTGGAAANSATIPVVALSTQVGSGARAGIYDDQVLNAGYADAIAAGVMFSPRIMNGKYSPASLVTDGSPTHSATDGVYHEPYNASGVTNQFMLRAGVQLYRHVFSWADAKNVTNPGSIEIIMIGTLPGMDYAELWFGGAGSDPITTLHGDTLAVNKARMVSSNADWIDALVDESAGRYTLGVGISGRGGLSDVIAPGIAAHAASYGAFNSIVVVNANGWGKPIGEVHIGEWGTTVSNEATFDANVWSEDVTRGVQDISVDTSSPRTAADWDDMVDNHAIGLQNQDAVWLEEYAYTVRNASGTGIGISGHQANQAAWDEMVLKFNEFNDIVTANVTTLPAGTTTYVTHTTIGAGEVLRFPPNSSATLVMDHSSLVIEGLLEMKPASASIVHELRFLCDDESFGAGGGIVVVPTDVGLWVMGDGRLDLQGTPKVGWNNTGTSSTWAPTDETFRNPINPPDAGTTWYANVIPHVQGSAVPTATAPTGRVFPTEVMNLTRNVKINGTVGTGSPGVFHRTHVFIRSTQPQTIKYVAFQYTAPMKYDPTRPGNVDYMTVVKGRWSLHFHDNMDGSRGSIVEGCVVRSYGGHAFVPHMSHGVTFLDCVAVSGNGSGFWWDLDSTITEDAVFDHCLATLIIPRRQLQVSGAPGFMLGFGGGSGSVDGRASNIVRNCVASCVRGNQTNAGFMWGREAGDAVEASGLETWTTENNIAHNNLSCGIFIWYNVGSKHLIDDQVCYYNGDEGVIQGAYHNTFMWDRLLSFGNRQLFELHAVSNYPDQSHGMPGAFIRDSYVDGITTDKHEVPSGAFNNPKPRWTVLHTTLSRNTVIRDFEGVTPPPGVPPSGNQEEIYIDFVRSLDVGGSDLEPADFTLTWMHPLSQWRVQRRDNTAYQLTEAVPSGALVSTDIAPFFYYVSNLALSTGGVGSPFLQQMVSALQRNAGTETWSLRAGSGPLPPGLAISNGGLISGTPTTVGTYPVSIEVTDPMGVQAYREYDFVVAASANLQITTSSLSSGVVGAAYSQQLTANGGVPPRTFSLVSGSLPPGLTVSSSGLISGTPTTAGNYSPTFRVTDSVAATAQRLLTIAVADLSPVFVSTSLPAGELTVAYANTVQVTAGAPPYTFTIDTGVIPPGLAMSSAGVFSGTPTVIGSYPLRLRVTDSLGRAAVRDFSIEVYAALVFATPSLPMGRVGEPYAENLTATGGVPPIVYSLEESQGPGTGELPPGLALSTAGVLSGIPTEAGEFTFTVEARDSIGVQEIAGATFTAIVSEQAAVMDRNQPKAFAQRRPFGGSRMREKVRHE